MAVTRRTLVGVFLVFVLFVTALTALAGEALVRRRERTRDTVPGSMPFIFYRHERLRYALVRGNSYYNWVNINPQGFRGAPVEVSKPAGAFRVMVVGGSTVFDSSVSSDEHAWPARLGHWLACAAPGRNIEVINAGVPGYVMMDNIIRLQSELYEYKPDLIVLYQAHNDLLAALHRIYESYAGATRPREVKPATPWGAWLERHSLLYTKVVLRMKVMDRRSSSADNRATLTPETYQTSLAAGAARHEKDLRTFLIIAKSFGIDLVVPEVAHIGSSDPHAIDADVREMWLRSVGVDPQYILSGYRQYEDVTQRITQQLGVKYLPTRAAGLEDKKWYSPGDPVHFNDQGADHMAEFIARGLVQAGAIPVAAASAGTKSNGACSAPAAQSN